jgi:hypothetical protein
METSCAKVSAALGIASLPHADRPLVTSEGLARIFNGSVLLLMGTRRASDGRLFSPWAAIDAADGFYRLSSNSLTLSQKI